MAVWRDEFLIHEVAEILGVSREEIKEMSREELEARLDALRLSRDSARRRHRIRMFVLRCRLRSESHLRIVGKT